MEAIGARDRGILDAAYGTSFGATAAIDVSAGGTFKPHANSPMVITYTGTLGANLIIDLTDLEGAADVYSGRAHIFNLRGIIFNSKTVKFTAGTDINFAGSVDLAITNIGIPFRAEHLSGGNWLIETSGVNNPAIALNQPITNGGTLSYPANCVTVAKVVFVDTTTKKEEIVPYTKDDTTRLITTTPAENKNYDIVTFGVQN